MFDNDEKTPGVVDLVGIVLLFIVGLLLVQWLVETMLTAMGQ